VNDHLDRRNDTEHIVSTGVLHGNARIPHPTYASFLSLFLILLFALRPCHTPHSMHTANHDIIPPNNINETIGFVYSADKVIPNTPNDITKLIGCIDMLFAPVISFHSHPGILKNSQYS
jgi:hypothetical protein